MGIIKMLRSMVKAQANGEFLKRWPKNPKIVFFASPNSFQDELTKRFAIDLGLPIISMSSVFANIQELAGHNEFKHPFFVKVKEMLDAGDTDALIKERVALKLLRITNVARDGFVLTDFPNYV